MSHFYYIECRYADYRIYYNYAECHDTECPLAECRSAEFHHSEHSFTECQMLSDVMLASLC